MCTSTLSLLKPPQLTDWSNITDLYRMLYLSGIEEPIPDDANLDSAANANDCYRGANRMKKPHTVDMPNCTTFANFYYGCNQLPYIVTFDTSNGQDFTGFVAATYLKYIPWFDMSNATDAENFAFSTPFLTSVAPNATTGNVQTWRGAFQQSDIREMPDYDFSGAVGANGMYRCWYVTNIQRFDINSIGTSTDARDFQRGNVFLIIMENFDWSTFTTTTNAFLSCTNLKRVIGCNCPVTISFANCAMQAAELDEIFTDLPTVVGQTITVTGNPGAGTCTPSIATTKGWTVVT